MKNVLDLYINLIAGIVGGMLLPKIYSRSLPGFILVCVLLIAVFFYIVLRLRCRRAELKMIAKNLIFIISLISVFSVALAPTYLHIHDARVQRVLLAFLLAANYVWLFWLMMPRKNKMGPERNTQIGEPFKVSLSNLVTHVDVRILLETENGEQPNIKMTRETFYTGIDFLKEQLRLREPAVSPDLFVGINAVGMLVACSLSRAVQNISGRGLLGYVTTIGDGHNIDKKATALPPSVREGDFTVLIVDSEAKSGNSLHNVCEHLKTCYKGNMTIKTCVLSGRVNTLIAETDENRLTLEKLLIGHGIFKSKNRDVLPDFLVFITDKQIIYPF